MKLELKKPILELIKKSGVPPFKMEDGKYVRRALATSKMKKMAQNIT